MHVVQISGYFASHRGGIEIVADHVAERLARDHDVSVTWLASAAGHTGDPAPTPRLTRIAVPANNAIERKLGLPLPVWAPGGMIRLWQSIGAADAVLLHDCLYISNIAAFLFAKIRRRPVVVVQHIGLVPYRQPLIRFVMTAANRLIAGPMLSRAQQAVFISETTRRYFRRFVRFRRPERLIFNGVDTDVFRPCAESERERLRRSIGVGDETKLYLFVGRFTEKKGLSVIRRLAEATPDAQWILAGWGAIAPESWNLANVRVERGRSGATLAELYRAADLLVLPSVGEGFPLVVQEAMACGTPALVGTETAMADPEAARLLCAASVDPDDVPGTGQVWTEALAACSTDVRQPAGHRAKLAAFAAERWSWKASAQAYVSLLASLATDATAEIGRRCRPDRVLAAEPPPQATVGRILRR